MKLHVDESKEFLVIDSCTQLEYDQLCISYNKDVKNARFSPNYKSGSWDGKINFMKGKNILFCIVFLFNPVRTDKSKLNLKR